MSDKLLSWKFAEEFAVESENITAARLHSLELGVEPITPSMGSQLSVIAAATAPSNMIEIGTGLGVSGMWLMRGAPEAILTTIDSELDYQQQARKSFGDSGIPANRVRLICGRAADVLPRMNEASYDLVFIDGDPQSVIEYVEHGLRLARRGGSVVIAHALWKGRVADPAHRDSIVANYRMLLDEIATSEDVISALSPVGDGLLQLTKLTD